LAVSALLGGAIVTAADMFGRVVLAPTEIPVGIVMAFIGAPFFLYLLLRRKHYD
ncbi:MAG: iron chelate uptake ABC transporter family permease subunit, partial [Oscillospiraceae bacterium]|nr:iron chelate uptake ABC transporter family permease subunit [Oscillospiraceae bacterium]